MQQPKLIKAKLIKRYKRFFADVKLEDGSVVTSHCANSGSMLGLLNEGANVYITPSVNPLNKLKYKLEFIENNSCMVGVNTHLTNKLALEAFKNKDIESLKNYDNAQPEVKYNQSRIDFLLSNNNDKCFVEVKNVTLKREPLIAEFPDCKTTRGAKHLKELISIKNNTKENIQAYNLYIVQRTDVNYFKIAKDIDLEYYENFILAKKSGVEFLCYDCDINLNTIKVNKKIEIIYD